MLSFDHSSLLSYILDFLRLWFIFFSVQINTDEVKCFFSSVRMIYLVCRFIKNLFLFNLLDRRLKEQLKILNQGVVKQVYSGKYYFESTLNEIKADLDANDPVIALLSFSPTSMHYVYVVAVSDNDDVAILDTNNSLYYYSKDDFEIISWTVVITFLIIFS